MLEVSDILYPSVITAPESSSKVFIASTGSGADPETTPLIDPDLGRADVGMLVEADDHRRHRREQGGLSWLTAPECCRCWVGAPG